VRLLVAAEQALDAGLGAVVWSLIEAPGRGWTSPEILSAFAAGVLIVAWERHTDQPMLDVTIFRNLRFSAASVSIAFGMVVASRLAVATASARRPP
jgi:hypothetical protein